MGRRQQSIEEMVRNKKTKHDTRGRGALAVGARQHGYQACAQAVAQVCRKRGGVVHVIVKVTTLWGHCCSSSNVRCSRRRGAAAAVPPGTAHHRPRRVQAQMIVGCRARCAGWVVWARRGPNILAASRQTRA